MLCVNDAARESVRRVIAMYFDPAIQKHRAFIVILSPIFSGTARWSDEMHRYGGMSDLAVSERLHRVAGFFGSFSLKYMKKEICIGAV